MRAPCCGTTQLFTPSLLFGCDDCGLANQVILTEWTRIFNRTVSKFAVALFRNCSIQSRILFTPPTRQDSLDCWPISDENVMLLMGCDLHICLFFLTQRQQLPPCPIALTFFRSHWNITNFRFILSEKDTPQGSNLTFLFWKAKINSSTADTMFYRNVYLVA